MSGHSKWHNIQKTKGAADAKRSAAFTKIAKEIIVAVKEGGGSGDPANNSRLATVIAKAKAVNMPNDNIKRTIDKALGAGSTENYEAVTYEGYGPGGVAVKEGGGSGDPNNNSRLATVIAKAKAVNMPNDNIKRTIDKALGAGSTENFEAVTYEGYGPGGVAVIVEALTDNRQRTAPEVRHAFDKCNGNMGAQGCVSWSFDRKGVIVIDNEEGELDDETVMMDALDAGAEDFASEGPAMEITTDPDAFNDVVKALEEKGYTFASAEIEMVPQNYITLSGEGDVKNMQKLIDMLEDSDDVQNVWHNWETN